MRVYSTVYHLQDEDSGYELQVQLGKPTDQVRNDITVYDVHSIHSIDTKIFLGNEVVEHNFKTDHPLFNSEKGLVLTMSDLERLIDRLGDASVDRNKIAHIQEVYHELDGIMLRMIKNDAKAVWIF